MGFRAQTGAVILILLCGSALADDASLSSAAEIDAPASFAIRELSKDELLLDRWPTFAEIRVEKRYYHGETFHKVSGIVRTGGKVYDFGVMILAENGRLRTDWLRIDERGD